MAKTLLRSQILSRMSSRYCWLKESLELGEEESYLPVLRVFQWNKSLLFGEMIFYRKWDILSAFLEGTTVNASIVASLWLTWFWYDFKISAKLESDVTPVLNVGCSFVILCWCLQCSNFVSWICRKNFVSDYASCLFGSNMSFQSWDWQMKNKVIS